MKNKDVVLLKKIIRYIEELKEFINEYTEEKFMKDKKTINASVFNLSQIGELASKVSDELIEEYSNIEWRGLKGLRNRIIHDYDGINLSMIWNFLQFELDDLNIEVKKILKNEE